jgi:hypothetical protein
MRSPASCVWYGLRDRSTTGMSSSVTIWSSGRGSSKAILCARTSETISRAVTATTSPFISTSVN